MRFVTFNTFYRKIMLRIQHLPQNHSICKKSLHQPPMSTKLFRRKTVSTPANQHQNYEWNRLFVVRCVPFLFLFRYVSPIGCRLIHYCWLSLWQYRLLHHLPPLCGGNLSYSTISNSAVIRIVPSNHIWNIDEVRINQKQNQNNQRFEHNSFSHITNESVRIRMFGIDFPGIYANSLFFPNPTTSYPLYRHLFHVLQKKKQTNKKLSNSKQVQWIQFPLYIDNYSIADSME